MDTPENNNLNPQITDVDIGVRDLRTIQIYPLALKDEKIFAAEFQAMLKKYFEQKAESDENVDSEENQLVAFAEYVIGLIEENFIKILGLVTFDEDVQEIYDSLTGMQASQIVMVIYRTNFEAPLKNASSLVEKIKSLLLSKRQLQPLSNDMDNTISGISTQDPSKMEDLPEDSS